ncbi:putative fibrosin-1 isoform X1 [Lissotriton helveticus]
MEAPPLCARLAPPRSRRSRSARDRRRPLRAVPAPPSSGSEGEERGPHPRHRRPPRRRVPTGPPPEPPSEEAEEEELIIDGFAICSFSTLEALQKDASLKPPQRKEHRMKHTGKRKRPDNDSEPEHPEGCPEQDLNQASGEKERRKQSKRSSKEVKWVGSESETGKAERKIAKRSESLEVGSDASGHSYLETGYVCDTESDSDGKVSCDGLESSFIISASKAPDFTTFNGGCQAKLSVLPKISGLERSREKNQEPEKDLLLVPLPPKESSSQAAAPGPLPTPVCTSSRPPTPARSRCQTPQLQTAARTTPQPKVHTPQNLPQPQMHMKVTPYNSQPLNTYTGGLDLTTLSSNRNSHPSKPVAANSQITHRPSTPSLPLPLSNHSTSHSYSSAVRAVSQHHHPAMFTQSPGLPPPPPLLQVPGHPTAEHELIRQDLSSGFLTSQGGAEMNTAVRPMAFQFHQHNHQHQHTHQHTHQHFTPYPPSIVQAPAPPMVRTTRQNFDKYPGQKDGLYRQNFYPFPQVAPVLPPAAAFGSLQGAFQPKSTNSDLPTRIGTVPPSLSQKTPQITDPFRPALRKSGKWCAMHVRVAYMILRHQEKVKLMQGDPPKLDFRNDLLTCLPGSGAFGALPPGHELARPATHFTATGAVHPAGAHFGPQSAPHGSFLNPSTHIDPFSRSTGYTPLASLTNGAFGGLGSPTFNPNPMFGQKDNSAAHSFTNPQDIWNRLRRTPPSFPTAPAQVWTKPGEAERSMHEKERENEKRTTPVIKDEKDRDLFSKHPVRGSPATPTHKPLVAHCSGRTSVGDDRGHGSSDVRDRERSRELADPSKDHYLSEQKLRDTHAIVESGLVRRLTSEDSKTTVAREHSPYVRTPVNESVRPNSRSSVSREATDRKPQLTPEQALRKHDVKVKEERKEEPDVIMTGFEMAQVQRANNVLHASPLQNIPHSQAGMHIPLHMSPAGMHSLNTLAMFDRPRAMAPYLSMGHVMGVGERFPHASFALEAWREPYRSNLEMHRRELLSRELALRSDSLQRLAAPRYFEHEQAFRDREPERAAAAALMDERAHMFREDYERARLYGLPHSALEAHLPHHTIMASLGGHLYSRINPTMGHPNSLLSKTPPINLLSAPPPLIPSTSTRPGSPPRRTTPHAAELRDLSALYKDRESR